MDNQEKILKKMCDRIEEMEKSLKTITHAVDYIARAHGRGSRVIFDKPLEVTIEPTEE